jgi:transposase
MIDKKFENFFGIDVSKEWLDIAIDAQVFRIAQSEKDIASFFRKFNSIKVKTLIVLESTGGYERNAANYLSEQGYTVHVAHPNKVKAFALAKGRLAKTDVIDAKLLSAYGRFIDSTEIRELPSKMEQNLRDLSSRIAQLKEMHQQESCRLGITSEKLVKESIELMLGIIKKEIMTVEEKVLSIIKSDAQLIEKYELLRSMKGVGPALAMILITSLPELGKANKKEIAALVGVAPITNQSGQKTGKAMTKFGRNSIRKILYMGALSVCRWDTKFKSFYEKLVAAGKPKKVAIVAVMRKMLVILNAMITHKKAFISLT